MTVFALWVSEDGRYDFSKTNNGGIEITDEDHAAFFCADALGKVIVPGASGVPELQDLPPPTPDELAMLARAWRDGAIADTQWLIDRHRDEEEDLVSTTLSTEQYNELRRYRKALREWPEAPDFPSEVSRPAMPEWLAGDAGKR